MGTVPQSYHDFCYYYAPYYYTINALMTLDAPAGQKDVNVEDGTDFEANMWVEIKDSAHNEWNQVDSILNNVVTMKNNLAYTYYVTKTGSVDHPDLTYGKGSFAGAFALEYLCEAYSAGQFASTKAAILTKIVEIADWLLTQQNVNPALQAYGGFESSVGSGQYWSVDAGRVIPALLKAFALTNDADYLASAVLAGYTFLYNMQHQPETLGLVDSYYGGFAQYVNSADAWSTTMMTEDLYDLIGLTMLADIYDKANAAWYNQMMADLVEFTRENGYERFYLYFQPAPYGQGTWYRVGLNDEQIYDDPISYAMRGLYAYEGWSQSNQRVYEFIQNTNQVGVYSAYHPGICWPGYIDIVTKAPDCGYYDAVTIGILDGIRKAHDKPSYELAYQIVKKYPDEFLYWGPLFSDYSPITPQKAITAVAWIARMFLNYSYPMNDLSLMLYQEGEHALLYSVQQAQDTTTYANPLAFKVLVNNVSVSETILESGYVLTDYLTVFSLIPVRPRDKIRLRGVDYEVQYITKVVSENEPLATKAQIRRLQNN